MYPVSSKFMKAVKQNTRQCYWSGKIITKENICYEFTDKEVLKGSGYITRQCAGNTEIELGTVYAAEMSITLLSPIDRYSLDNASIHLFYHLELESGQFETVPMGIFEISEANRRIHCLELKGYDYMLRFEKNLKLTASSGTPYDFIALACTMCQVEMAQTKSEISALPNGKEILGIYADNDMETYRDLLFYVAQVLGCFCQIDRSGKLILKAYTNHLTDTVLASERFSSSYSDFVTRYTAVSSTNMLTEETEYYALENDDGLTLNLGVNPFLQFGFKDTRIRLIKNILNAIAIVRYVPFDATTIGNPALEVGDVLSFVGGHADETQLSCITSITYKIGGKHSLKCIGKNPKLATSKSKNDKNITGLLNTIETNKVTIYNFMNTIPFTIGELATEVLNITFTSKEETTAQFQAEILLSVAVPDIEKTIKTTLLMDKEEIDENGNHVITQVETPIQYNVTEKGEADLTVIYKLNLEEIKTFYPKQTYSNGNHVLTLFLPISPVIENSQNTLSIFLKMEGGTLSILESQIRATVSGQGLVAGISKWDGRIQMMECIDRLLLSSTFKVDRWTTSLQIKQDKPELIPLINNFSRLSCEGDFKLHHFETQLDVCEKINTFTINKSLKPEFMSSLIECSEESFCLRTSYPYQSSETPINYGQLHKLSVSTDMFSKIDTWEVKKCQ